MLEIGKYIKNEFLENDFQNRINTNVLALKDYCLNVSLNSYQYKSDEEDLYFSTYSIESSLMFNCVVACIKTDVGYYILPCTILRYDIVGNPSIIRPNMTTYSGVSDDILLNTFLNKDFDSEDFVVGWSSFSRFKMLGYMNTIIDELAIILSVEQQLTQTLRQPYIVNTDDKKLFNDKLMINNILNKDVVYTEELDKISILNLPCDTNRLEVLETLRKDRFKTLNGLLGVSYDADLKKERLIVDELHTREEVKELCGQSLYKSRKDFCDNIFKKFGKTITVSKVLTEESEQKEDITGKEEFNYE